MNRLEFCDYHWEYYLVLEKDFLETERFVSFDLGNNAFYTNDNSDLKASEVGNSLVFSNEYVKQYQTICSEVDVIMKTICKEINSEENRSYKNILDYTSVLLAKWPELPQQEVRFKRNKLQPFRNWHIPVASDNSTGIDWWKPYNDVKHNRLASYKKANLKNVINALAGLYILEQYLVKYIADNADCSNINEDEKEEYKIDVPNSRSKLFEMVNWNTNDYNFEGELYFSIQSQQPYSPTT